jgi:hypothetical protein
MPKRHPLLYQLNTRILLQERGRALGRPATLDDVPDALLDEIAARRFDWAWFLGVWTTGPAARAVSRSRADWRAAFRKDLPDLRDEDITGSPFAIQAYDVTPEFGGDAALARLRDRLGRRGLSLLLDFVPNHVSPDHPWVRSHPEFFVEGTLADLEREPQNYLRVELPGGVRILAHGRDPYFPGWPDTLQLNYLHAGLRAAMAGELERVAQRCDAVRCDMAMLVLPEVFRRTWGDKARPSDGTKPVETSFWPEAIGRVRRTRPGFLFMAEVYWDLEWQLQQQGFDFTYDKRLYDRLEARQATPVREHLFATPEFQDHSARFLENHDEPRAAATFPLDVHRAAATIAFLVPGLRFLHEGQLDGRKVHVSMHVGRRPDEPPDPAVRAFYDRLLPILARDEIHRGWWRLRECRAAWDGNGTWDRFVVMSWEGENRRRLLVVVNYGPTQAQCYASAGFAGTEEKKLVLTDLLGDARYERDGSELAGRGLYLDLPPWGHQVFEVAERPGAHQ